MNRRQLLLLGLSAPLARLARFFPEWPAVLRMFADLKHTGTLTEQPAAFPPAATDFGIAVPLPSMHADRDVLPEKDANGAGIVERLGRLRVETDAGEELVAVIKGENTGALRLFRKSGDGWRRVSSDTDVSWRLTPDETGVLELGVAVVLPEAVTGPDEPAWPRAFTFEIGTKSNSARRAPFRVAPYIIPCALDPVDEIWIVSRSNTIDSVKAVEVFAARAGLALHIHQEREPCDQWIQDTIEPGLFTFPTTRGTEQVRGVLTGMRKEFGGRAAGLDQQIADRLRERGEVAVVPGVPRKLTRWIDWYGNLEATPRHTDRRGKRFPYGRVITGKQRELAMHPGVMRFLEAQGIQWPPIVVDTSWLTIGHVDEVVNFVPAKTALGYKVLLPSPKAARDLLDALVSKKLGETAVFADTRDMTTVSALRERVAGSEENLAIDEAIARVREQLKAELNLQDADFVMLPALFNRGRALIPNAVNCLVANGYVAISEPRGPRHDGKDLFEDAIREALAPCGVQVVFIDTWGGYHVAAGEIHCGTNTFRRLRDAAWWTHEVGAM